MQILVRIIIAICSVFRYTAPKVRERSGHARHGNGPSAPGNSRPGEREAASPTELVNAAYDYVLATGELPDAQRGESPLRITLTDAQANELRFRLRQATRPVPASFWEARDGAPATREGE